MDEVHDTTELDATVEVWNAFTEKWTGGFAIAEVVDRGYRLRRMSDGALLPVVLGVDRVRTEAPARRAFPAAG